MDADAMKRFATDRADALFNRGEIDRVEEFVTPDFVNHEAWPGEDPGFEGFRLRLRRLHMLRMRDGRASEHWATRDDLGMLQQLGVIPAPGGAG